MKIGIITFHASDNCGSMLQAYALQTILEKKYKCETEIIDFSSKGQRQMYSLWDTKLRPRIIKSNLKAIPYWKSIKRMKFDYKEFSETNFHLTEKKYKNNDELFELKEKYDIVIAGGDQVWNIRCRDTDLAYFLNFVGKSSKVAYSPSLGAVNINQYASDPSVYKKLLEKFDYLSVREPNGQKWLEELIGRKVPIIADPTMLLTKEQWLKSLNVKSTGIKGKFIFYYAFSYSNTVLNERLSKVANEMGMKVVVLEKKAWSVNHLDEYKIELFERSGPLAFIELMNEAEAVVTDSFHGTLFSALFNKNFCNFRHKVEMDPDDDRSQALLSQLGLEDHYVLGEEIRSEDLWIPTDYEKVNDKIEAMRIRAFDYINSFTKMNKEK
ncbi:polysaccharide pyruvyl transferase family protein [Blautia sp. HCP3S3_D9]|uniref:polysaccharide pyruvyl transferase family protein n=1 Tax=Blautia sp. HCP3S3_D9 TaxID=3438912 RepID=UPI003F89A412